MSTDILPPVYWEKTKFPDGSEDLDNQQTWWDLLPHRFARMCVLKAKIKRISLLSEANQGHYEKGEPFVSDGDTHNDLYRAIFRDSYAMVEFLPRPDLPDELQGGEEGIRVELCVYDCGLFNTAHRVYKKDGNDEIIIGDNGKPILDESEPLIYGFWNNPWMAFCPDDIVTVLYDPVRSNVYLNRRLIIIGHSDYDGVNGKDNDFNLPVESGYNDYIRFYITLPWNSNIVDKRLLFYNNTYLYRLLNESNIGRNNPLIIYTNIIQGATVFNYINCTGFKASYNNYIIGSVYFENITATLTFKSAFYKYPVVFNKVVPTYSYIIRIDITQVCSVTFSIGQSVFDNYAVYTHIIDNVKASIVLSIPELGGTVILSSGYDLGTNDDIDLNTFNYSILPISNYNLPINFCLYETVGTPVYNEYGSCQDTPYSGGGNFSIDIKYSSYQLVDVCLKTGNCFFTKCDNNLCVLSENAVWSYECPVSGTQTKHYHSEINSKESEELITQYKENGITLGSNTNNSSIQSTTDDNLTAITSTSSIYISENGNLYVIVDMDIVNGVFLFIELRYSGGVNLSAEVHQEDSQFIHNLSSAATYSIFGELKLYCAKSNKWTIIEQGSGDITVKETSRYAYAVFNSARGYLTELLGIGWTKVPISQYTSAESWAINNITSDGSDSGYTGMAKNHFKRYILLSLLTDIEYTDEPGNYKSIDISFNFFAYNFDRGQDYHYNYAVWPKVGVQPRCTMGVTPNQHTFANPYQVRLSNIILSHSDTRDGTPFNCPKHSLISSNSGVSLTKSSYFCPDISSFIVPKINDINAFWHIFVTNDQKVVIVDFDPDNFGENNCGYVPIPTQ